MGKKEFNAFGEGRKKELLFHSQIWSQAEKCPQVVIKHGQIVHIKDEKISAEMKILFAYSMNESEEKITEMGWVGFG